MKIYLNGKIWGYIGQSKKYNGTALCHIKSGVSGAWTSGNLTGMHMLYAKGTTLKKTKVSFIVHFCLGKSLVSLFNSIINLHGLFNAIIVLVEER